MERRSFLGLLGGAAAALAGTGTSKGQFYVVENFYLKDGTQLPPLHDFLSKSAIVHGRTVVVLEALVAAHMPHVALINGFSTLEQVTSMRQAQTKVLLQAAEYSPEIGWQRERRKTPRVFELRVYQGLHEPFAGPGIHPLFCARTLTGGPSTPNLTYLIPFENLAEREKAWAAFGGDPEWAKVRAESRVVQMSLYKAALYSPVQ